MKKKQLIISGSSRSDGNTNKIVQQLVKEKQIEFIDLNNYSISYFNYEYKNKEDDFLPLIKKIIEQYDTFFFITPVYWYNMSGIMKVFFDRFSDLLFFEKNLGRKLRGKNMYVISNSNDINIDPIFYIPFKKSAEYLGMNYIGEKHYTNVSSM